MKTKDRLAILEDVLPASQAPDFETVLARLRQDRKARASQRGAAAILGVTAACLALLALATRPGENGGRAGDHLALAAAVPLRTVSDAVPEIRRISDDELQGAIDRPSAIVTLPDGRKRLLVLMPRS